MSAALPLHLAGLLSPRAYPHAVERVQLVQTHVSWVLLTGEFAYKIKRPVHYAFIDLRTAQRRAFYCAEELRLNRRFAPTLYLDIVEITSVNGEACVGGGGAVIEQAVRMRQFDRSQELDRLLEVGAIDPAELERFGRELAQVHTRLPLATAHDSWGRPDTVRKLLLENIDQSLQAGLEVDFRAALIARLDALQSGMAMRASAGRVRECHGDLHARNIVRLQDHLVPFDCMEFEPAFRWTDVAEEVAFLLADLDARGYAGHGHAFLAGYLAQSADFGLCRVLDVYKSHHALVRAKVNALSEPPEPHQAYLQTARCSLAPRHPMLVLMSGLSGSGKTWLAGKLATAFDAVHVRSDVERKRLAGLAEQARSGAQLRQGVYSPAGSRQLYAHLAACAEEILAGGYDAIVDATFLRREERRQFVQLALGRAVPLRFIRCTAPPDVLRRRVTQRRSLGADASEAGIEVLEWQIIQQEPVHAEEGIDVIEVDTAADEVESSLPRLLQRLRPDGAIPR